jgi:hypothetical protein
MVEVRSISDIIADINPKYKKGPEAEHHLMYDSASETLEPVYFFILDLLNSFGLNPEKLIDNFSSTPGSGHFGEMGQRAAIMQQQGSKLLGDINTVLRSILNIVYDLRDFRVRLESYENLESEDKHEREAAVLSLKQIWLDKVDIQKGNSSIKAMGLGQSGFVTLIDAFLAIKDEKEVDKIDLNERVKRILRPRVQEFNTWLRQSGAELKKRYEIEKTYLKSQVNSLKIYSRWAKPYLKAAADLEQKDQNRNPNFVKLFDTTIFELTLLGKNKVDPASLALEGEYPREFAKEKFLRKFKRSYYSCILVDFRFRSIPQRIGQQGHFAFGGRAEVTFKAYALNDDELKKLDQELKDSDLGDMLSLVEGTTEESMGQLKKEIEFYLEEPDKEEKSKSKKPNDTSNPFLALIGAYNEPPKKTEESKPKKEDDKIENIPKEDWYEKEFFRKTAQENAISTAFTLFDLYKKAHRMPSYT